MDIPVVAKGVDSSLKVMSQVTNGLANYVKRNRDAASFRASLGLERESTLSYRVACSHPLFAVGLPHPDDLAAFASVVGSDLPSWSELVPLPEDTIIEDTFADNYVLIGSPEAEAFTQLLFGYEPIAGGSKYVEGIIRLPFRWEEDPQQVHTKYKRFVEGNPRITSRPNWPIIDQRSDQRKSIFPQLGKDGFLQSDLLLITKIPNYTSKLALQSGRFIVSVAGTHGVGTRAIGLVLNNRKLMAELHSLTHTWESFQLLLRVSEITHSAATGSSARRVELLQAAEVVLSDAALRDARWALWRREPGWRRRLTDTAEEWRFR